MKTFNYSLKNADILDVIDFKSFINEENILVQIFCGNGKNKLQNVSNTVYRELPNAVCIGTTSDGEITDSHINTSDTIVSISIFEQTSIKGSYSNEIKTYEDGVNFAKQIIQSNTKLVILFASFSSQNIEDYLKGINSINENIMICGGVASTNTTIEDAHICFKDKVLKSGIVGVSLNSDILKVHNELRYNWQPIGIKHEITEVKDNRVFSIDNMNPSDFYEKYLGADMVDTLPNNGQQFPLLLLKDEIPMGRVVISKDDISMTFNGTLKKGDIVKFGFGQAEMIMKDPYKSYENLFKHHSQSFFVYSCMARRRYLPEHIYLEVEPFSNIATTTGFFTHGEFYHHNKSIKFLNHTLTVVSLSESNKKAKDYITKSNFQINQSSQGSTIQTLTNLIKQSSTDYYELNDELEQRVKDRTLQLEESNVKLKYTLQNLEQTKDDLLTSEKMATLGELVGSVTHEINTPLGLSITVASHMEILNHKIAALYHENNISKDEFENFLKQSDESIKMITSNLKRTKELVDSFKNIAVDQAIEDKRVFNVKNYIDEILMSLKSKIARTKHSVKVDCPHKIILNSYPGFLAQILTNLINNSIFHAFNENESGLISIIVTQDDDNINLTYNDNGNGLSQEQKERIFDQYYTTKKGQGGTGLGLYIIKTIITEKLKGTIELTDAKKGLEFKISIPK